VRMIELLIMVMADFSVMGLFVFGMCEGVWSSMIPSLGGGGISWVWIVGGQRCWRVLV